MWFQYDKPTVIQYCIPVVHLYVDCIGARILLYGHVKRLWTAAEAEK